ncbi:MAG: hypothetical protein K1Y36_15685 [Blastocatellia bacterium]|nr:hypothetical protein [Blastocatellia bacterium]
MKSTIEQLTQTGLIVKPTGEWGPYKNGFLIAQPFFPNESGYEDCCGYLFIDQNTQIKIHDDVVYVFPKENDWWFDRWAYVPGPGPDDVEWCIGDFETALGWVYQSFWGTPTILDGWVLPTHRHPEWEVTKVPEVVWAARFVGQDLWQQLEAEEQNAYSNLLNSKGPIWPRILESSFISIENQKRPDVRLELRRDLAVAYIREIAGLENGT